MLHGALLPAGPKPPHHPKSRSLLEGRTHPSLKQYHSALYLDGTHLSQKVEQLPSDPNTAKHSKTA